MLGLVREQWRSRDVADGIDAGHIGLAVAVDHDDSAIGFNTNFFQAQILDIADYADRRNHALEFYRLRLLAVVDGGDHAVALFLELCHFGIGEDLDALFFEAFARKPSDLGILYRKDLRQHLDHGHLRTHGVKERRKLDTDGAGAHHQERLRHLLRDHRLEIGPDQLVVGLEPRQHPGPRPGGEDDVFGLIGALTQRALRRFDRRFLDRDLAGRIDHGLAPDHRDLVLLHQEADAVVEAL